MTDEEIMFIRLFAPIKAKIQDKNRYITELEKENAELKKKYDELNDFSNSQCAELLKENQELKAELEKEKRRSMNIQKICFDSCL